MGWFTKDKPNVPRDRRSIPILPDGAPDQQALDYAAVIGVVDKRVGGMSKLLQIREAYLRKWHNEKLGLTEESEDVG